MSKISLLHEHGKANVKFSLLIKTFQKVCNQHCFLKLSGADLILLLPPTSVTQKPFLSLLPLSQNASFQPPSVDSSRSLSSHSSCLLTLDCFVWIKHQFFFGFLALSSNFPYPHSILTPQRFDAFLSSGHQKACKYLKKWRYKTHKSGEPSNTQQRRARCRLIPSRIVQIKRPWWDWRISPSVHVGLCFKTEQSKTKTQTLFCNTKPGKSVELI